MRYFGHYSFRARGERKKKATPAQTLTILQSGSFPIEEKNKPSYGWAECMRRVHEIDPLECPKCGSRMRIIAFLNDENEIEKIMRAQGVAKAQAPPQIPLPKLSTDEFLKNDFPVDDLEYA